MFSMRKMRLISLLFVLLFTAQALAAPSLRVKSDRYDLKVVRETPGVEGGISNHYFNGKEDAQEWTKMVVIQTYPYVSDPVKTANHIQQMYSNDLNIVLGKMQSFRKEAILPAVMITNTAVEKPFFEHTVMRFMEGRDGGVILIQYIERVPVARNAKEKDVRKIIKDIEKTQPSIVQALRQIRLPEIVKELTE